MSELRFRPPSRNNVNDNDQSVVNSRQIPTPRRVGQPQPSNNLQQHEPIQNVSTPIPPTNTFNVEDDYLEEENKKKKSGIVKKLLFSLLAVVIVLGSLYAGAYLNSTGSIPYIDNNLLVNNSNTNPLLEEKDSTKNIVNNKNFNGEPIPVKWPKDIKPTRMDVNVDPTTKETQLVLIGEKAGLGTVIRSYNSDGNLSGYWVIIPDSEDQNLNQYKNTPNEDKTSTDNSQQTNTTPVEETKEEDTQAPTTDTTKTE